MIEIENTCVYLKFLCTNNQNINQLFYWLTPTPNNCLMLENFKAGFDKMTVDLNTIAVSSGFKICDRYDLWIRRPDLVASKVGYFTLHGNSKPEENFQ